MYKQLLMSIDHMYKHRDVIVDVIHHMYKQAFILIDHMYKQSLLLIDHMYKQSLMLIDQMYKHTETRWLILIDQMYSVHCRIPMREMKNAKFNLKGVHKIKTN